VNIDSINNKETFTMKTPHLRMFDVANVHLVALTLSLLLATACTAPGQDDAQAQKDARIAELENQVAALEAERAASGAGLKTDTTPPPNEENRSGDVGGWNAAGDGFYYRNIRFKNNADLGLCDIIGEMKNESGQDYSAVSFQFSAYNSSGELLATTPLILSNFGNGQTKSFNDMIAESLEGRFNYKISFDNGF